MSCARYCANMRSNGMRNMFGIELSPSENPNGIPPQSPGLRGTSYPGSSSNKHFQPQRGCGRCRTFIMRDIRHNRVAVEFISDSEPKVASQARQPWAGGHNPFGIGYLYGRAGTSPCLV